MGTLCTSPMGPHQKSRKPGGEDKGAASPLKQIFRGETGAL